LGTEYPVYYNLSNVYAFQCGSSLCIFNVRPHCSFSMGVLTVCPHCVFSMYVFSMCVLNVRSHSVFSMYVFSMCVHTVWSQCVFSMCVINVRPHGAFLMCVLVLVCYNVCHHSGFSICLLTVFSQYIDDLSVPSQCMFNCASSLCHLNVCPYCALAYMRDTFMSSLFLDLFWVWTGNSWYPASYITDLL